jgi:hypothetical protein
VQECRFTTPQDAGITVLSMGGWDTHSSALGLQTQHYETDSDLLQVSRLSAGTRRGGGGPSFYTNHKNLKFTMKTISRESHKKESFNKDLF